MLRNKEIKLYITLLAAVAIVGFVACYFFNPVSGVVALSALLFMGAVSFMLKSVGMTPKGFSKMINYESIFYGIKSLFYGLPVSIIVMYLIHRSLMNSFDYSFALPWISILYVIGAVFVIVSSAMLYSSSKVKKENIIDALKQENI